eukprot:6182052-Pleurochrysis_carterae.AAC.1
MTECFPISHSAIRAQSYACAIIMTNAGVLKQAAAPAPSRGVGRHWRRGRQPHCKRATPGRRC